jgi:hypothetical protein
LTRFIKQHNLFRHRTKPLSAEQKAAYKGSEIEKHFADFIQQYNKLGIAPENVWNFDETGFWIGYLAGYLVFTCTQKQVYISDPDNQEQIMSIEAINITGKSINLIIIIPGIIIYQKHFDNNLDNNILFAISKSGYINNILSYK